MAAAQEARRGRRAFGLTVTAFLWSVGLVAAALLVPVYSGTEATGPPGLAGSTTTTSSTLVGGSGRGVLLVVSIPVLVTVFVWLALHDKCTHGRQGSGYVAWVLIGLLWAFCVLGALTIGIFVLPVALLLALAASLTPSGAAPGSAA